MSTTHPNTSRKKLYFDFALAAGATRAIFPCTQFRAGLTINERFNGCMTPLMALTGSSTPEAKVEAEVTAWVVSQHGGPGSATVDGNRLFVDLIGATASTYTGAIFRLPYLTVGGSISTKAGQSAVFGTAGIPRHFAVRVRRPSGTANTVFGTVYVQRQHSLEV